MHTLGHDFVPDPIHAGGLRYHGMSPLISHIYELGLIEAIAIAADRVLRGRRSASPAPRASCPAPEPTHALAAVHPRRRWRCKEIRRGEGHPHRAVRARPLRPGRLRRLPRRPDGRRGGHRRAVRRAAHPAAAGRPLRESLGLRERTAPGRAAHRVVLHSGERRRLRRRRGSTPGAGRRSARGWRRRGGPAAARSCSGSRGALRDAPCVWIQSRRRWRPRHR